MKSQASRWIVAGTAALVLTMVQASVVKADSILNFSLDNPDSITATQSGSMTTIATTASNEAATISLLNGSSVNITDAEFTLSATSSGAATQSGSLIQQDYNGSFSITWGSSQQYYLNGTFTGLTFGFSGGTGASLVSSDPPATLTLTSNAIGKLDPPSTANFTFSNVTPGLGIVETGSSATISGFMASGSGTLSASPEPSSMALAGLGALGLIGYGLRRRKALAV